MDFILSTDSDYCLGLLAVQSSSLRFDLFHKSRVAELFHRTCWVRPSDSHGALAKIRLLDYWRSQG